MTTATNLLKESLRSQFDFHFDGTQRLVALARRLSKEQLFEENPYRPGGIQAIFVHLLGADRFWRGVLLGSPGLTEAETEIAQLLTEAGHSPGDVDYFDYVAVRRGE
jgi:uncharacterized damage-inducible protein DinB